MTRDQFNEFVRYILTD